MESLQMGKVHENIHGRKGMSLSAGSADWIVIRKIPLFEQMGLLASFQLTLHVVYCGKPNCEEKN